jgi:hypothetical protein
VAIGGFNRSLTLGKGLSCADDEWLWKNCRQIRAKKFQMLLEALWNKDNQNNGPSSGNAA